MTTKSSLSLGVALALLGGLSTGCLEKAPGQPGAQFGALLRGHFAGSAQMARDTNAAPLREIWALPATAELRAQVWQKLAGAPYRFWQARLPAGVPEQAALFQPLLDDLAARESYLEVRGPTAAPEVALAIQLDDARAALWRTNLWQIVQGWKLGAPQPLAGAAGAGWEVKLAQPLNVLQCLRVGQWTILGLGRDRLSLAPALAQQTAKTGRPVAALAGVWLDVQADLPGLRPWAPFLAEYPLPPVHLTLAGRGGNLRTEARLVYADKLPWRPEPWRIPTNSIREPLVSFTAARGVAPLLAEVKGVPALGLKSLPNQFCSWAQNLIFAQTYFAAPMPEATNALRQLARTLPQFMRLHLRQDPGPIGYLSNRAELVWQALPLASPHLLPFHEGGAEYLAGGLFPLVRTTSAPAPAQLFAQIAGRDNLAYYDWEMSSERIVHARPLYQLTDIFYKRQFTPTNAPSQKWAAAIRPYLGNTVTEITVTGPKELTLVRKSRLGFTAIELFTLLRWADAPGFPLKFEPPPPRPDPRTLIGRTNSPPNRPATAAPPPAPAPRPPGAPGGPGTPSAPKVKGLVR